MEYKQFQKGTIKNTALQYNLFLKNIATVITKGIQEIDKDNNIQLFSQYLYFIGFEPTRKIANRRYLPVTTKIALYKP